MKKIIFITLSALSLIFVTSNLPAFGDGQSSNSRSTGTSAMEQAQQTLAEAKYQYCLAQASLGVSSAQVAGGPIAAPALNYSPRQISEILWV